MIACVSLMAFFFVAAVPAERFVEDATNLGEGELAAAIVRDLAKGWSGAVGLVVIVIIFAVARRHAGATAWAALGIAVLGLGTRVLEMLAIHVRVGDVYAESPPTLPWETPVGFHEDLFLFAAKWALPVLTVMAAIAILFLRRKRRPGSST